MPINQSALNNWRVTTLALIKAIANANVQTLCFCDETDTLYKYDPTSGATADDTYILITGAGGTTRWVGIAGQYVFTSSKSSGAMYISAPVVTSAVGDTPVKANGTTTSLRTDDFTHSNGRLTYIGKVTKKFDIATSVSSMSDAGNVVLGMFIAKGGIYEAASMVERKIGTANDVGCCGLIYPIDLAENEYVETFISTDAGTPDITVTKMPFVITEV